MGLSIREKVSRFYNNKICTLEAVVLNSSEWLRFLRVCEGVIVLAGRDGVFIRCTGHTLAILPTTFALSPFLPSLLTSRSRITTSSSQSICLAYPYYQS